MDDVATDIADDKHAPQITAGIGPDQCDAGGAGEVAGRPAAPFNNSGNDPAGPQPSPEHPPRLDRALAEDCGLRPLDSDALAGGRWCEVWVAIEKPVFKHHPDCMVAV